METFEAVRTILAVRQYQDTQIPDEIVHRILEAGWLTGSARNLQPWNFIIVEDREMLQKVAEKVKTGPYITQAALAIIVVVENTRFAVSDGSRAIQSMMLAAWSEGVGSNWVGFTGIEGIKPLLGIPESLDVLAILPLGYPVKKIGKGKKKRKPFNQVVYKEMFGKMIE
jgi:nitroreductase